MNIHDMMGEQTFTSFHCLWAESASAAERHGENDINKALLVPLFTFSVYHLYLDDFMAKNKPLFSLLTSDIKIKILFSPLEIQWYSWQ